MTPFSIYRSGGGTVDAADLKSADESRTGSNPVPSTFVWCAYISAPIGKGKDRVSCCRRREDAASFNGGVGSSRYLFDDPVMRLTLTLSMRTPSMFSTSRRKSFQSM